jgi:hypothetical protein
VEETGVPGEKITEIKKYINEMKETNLCSVIRYIGPSYICRFKTIFILQMLLVVH